MLLSPCMMLARLNPMSGLSIRFVFAAICVVSYWTQSFGEICRKISNEVLSCRSEDFQTVLQLQHINRPRYFYAQPYYSYSASPSNGLRCLHPAMSHFVNTGILSGEEAYESVLSSYAYESRLRRSLPNTRSGLFVSAESMQTVEFGPNGANDISL